MTSLPTAGAPVSAGSTAVAPSSSHPSPNADRLDAVGASPVPPVAARILVYSDDYTVRDAVRVAVGNRPSREVHIDSWSECATADSVHQELAGGKAIDYHLLILDGEATPVGGMGLCRDLKTSIADCPQVLVLTGRAQDGWLATWAMADGIATQPVEPGRLCEAVAGAIQRGWASRLQPGSASPTASRAD